MRPTSRENDHLRSDDGRTDRHSPNPLIDSAHPDGWAERKPFRKIPGLPNHVLHLVWTFYQIAD